MNAPSVQNARRERGQHCQQCADKEKNESHYVPRSPPTFDPMLTPMARNRSARDL